MATKKPMPTKEPVKAQRRKEPETKRLELSRNQIREVSTALCGVQKEGTDFERVVIESNGDLTLKGLFSKAQRKIDLDAQTQTVTITGVPKGTDIIFESV